MPSQISVIQHTTKATAGWESWESEVWRVKTNAITMTREKISKHIA